MFHRRRVTLEVAFVALVIVALAVHLWQWRSQMGDDLTFLRNLFR